MTEGNKNDLVDTQGFEEDFSDAEHKSYKLYNFRRPDKFSKDHLRGLQDIHREFARQLELLLTAYLRMQVNIDVVSVDQLTYDEFTRSMPDSITIGINIIGFMLIQDYMNNSLLGMKQRIGNINEDVSL